MKLFNRVILVMALLLAGLVVGEAQITIPYNFTAGSTISSTQVNSNFSTLGSNSLNRTGGTMTGTLTSVAITPSANNTYALGGTSSRYSTIYGVLGNFSGATTFTGAATFGGTTILNGLTYTWPSAQTANFALTTNGSGTLSWTAAGCGTTVAKTTNYTAVVCDIIEVTSGTLTITLPAASTCSGTANSIGIKNDTTNVQTINRAGSDTIDGATSFTTAGAQYESYDLVCNAAGNGWMVR